MGWSTELFTNITYNRKSYNSLREVESDYNDICDMIKNYESELKSLALITEPKKFCDEEQDPMWFLTNKVDDIIDELQDLYVDRYKLGILMDVWGYCHDKDGNAIPSPDNIHWDTAFLEGDFIKTKENKDDFEDIE